MSCEVTNNILICKHPKKRPSDIQNAVLYHPDKANKKQIAATLLQTITKTGLIVKNCKK